MTLDAQEISQLAHHVKAQDRRQLSKAITLVESQNPKHWPAARALLDALLPIEKPSIRVGISGPPGAGKSTLIEALGSYLLAQELSVGVLAVDPTSPLTGGSLLADKTRMSKLSRHEKAFVRPAPSRGVLGGVGPTARESLIVLEAAQFDVILVETVGTGQSESAVASMVDTFLLVLSPLSGDELQGVKKGILELSDVICVNKADGSSKKHAEKTRSDYKKALALIRQVNASPWQIPVTLSSALEGEGIAEIWQAVLSHRAWLEEGGALLQKRREQSVQWFWQLVENAILAKIKQDKNLKAQSQTLTQEILSQQSSPWSAAAKLIGMLEI